jgi:hypothetical protein
MVQSVVYFKQGRSFLAVLFAGAGSLVKFFPAFLLPYLIVKSGNRRVAFLGMIPAVAAGLLGYALAGHFFLDLLTIIGGRGTPNFNGLFYTQGLTWQLSVIAAGLNHFPSLFEFVFVPGYIVLTIIALWKRIPIYSYFLLTIMLFFLTYNMVNPQYLLWVVAPLILMGRERESFVFSILGSLYILLDYSYTYFLNPALSWNYFSYTLGQVEQLRSVLTGSLPVLLSLGLFSTFYYIVTFWKELRINMPAKAELAPR